MIVVLSKASVASEWCRKELTAGLVRELEEKRVVVMPILIGECSIPLFLREKKYADFRSSFDTGLADLLKAVARVTNDTRSRIEEPTWHTDWSVDWGMQGRSAVYTLTFVEQAIDKPYSCLAILRVKGNAKATTRYKLYEKEGLSWIHRHLVLKLLAAAAKKLDLRVILEDPYPKTVEFGVRDEKSGLIWEVSEECRLLGQDTGSDVLVDIAGLLGRALAHTEASARPPTDDEMSRMARVMATIM